MRIEAPIPAEFQQTLQHFAAFAFVFCVGLFATPLLGWVLDSSALFLWPQFVLAPNGFTSLLNEQHPVIGGGYSLTITTIFWVLVAVGVAYAMRRRHLLVTLLAAYPIMFLITAIAWVALNALGVGTYLVGP